MKPVERTVVTGILPESTPLRVVIKWSILLLLTGLRGKTKGPTDNHQLYILI